MDINKIHDLDRSRIKGLMKQRDPSANKGDYGHSLIIAGGIGKMGAAVIAAKACLRSGTGRLTVSVPRTERAILQIAIPEAMLIFRGSGIDFTKFSSTGFGPGIGKGKDALILLNGLLASYKGPLLLDADALNILAEERNLFKKLHKGTILTPHPVEFDRLFGPHRSEEERRTHAIRLAAEHQLVIVLKGHRTLVSSAGQSLLNTTGNAGLAKGGSGDALSGIITAMLAQGYEPFVAAQMGVYLHGLAADIALGKQSMESMLIDDVIGCLGKAFRDSMSKV